MGKRFAQLNLEGADFTGATLTGAHFSQCNLEGVISPMSSPGRLPVCSWRWCRRGREGSR